MRTQSAIHRLPVGVRICLARMTLWNRRHGATVWSLVLLSGIALTSAAMGYLAGMQSLPQDQREPWRMSDSYSANDTVLSVDQDSRVIHRTGFPSASQWGELQANIIKLRVLFKRLAVLGELQDPEFHLDLALGPGASLHQLSPSASPGTDLKEQFILANRAVTHMSHRSGVLLSIYQQRHQSEALAVSGLPVEQGSISSVYGFRTDPRTGRRQFHHGVDYVGRKGSKVLALADGVVTYSGKNGGYGNLVELQHADGYRSRYAHNESNLVRVGNFVSKGQAIATMGSTGRSTGTHVHVEVRRDSRTVDPMQFIR